MKRWRNSAGAIESEHVWKLAMHNNYHYILQEWGTHGLPDAARQWIPFILHHELHRQGMAESACHCHNHTQEFTKRLKFMDTFNSRLV